MSDDKVSVKLAHPHDGKNPGDTVSVEEGDAKRLIRGGIAVPATVAAAKATNTDPAEAATKR